MHKHYTCQEFTLFNMSVTTEFNNSVLHDIVFYFSLTVTALSFSFIVL